MDMESVRKDFPSIRNGKGIYLDSACQTLRPDSVIAAMDEYYSEFPACGGRSVHSMASRVSMEVDAVREKLASFFGTGDPQCYSFALNTTHALNTVANGLDLGKGDVVVTADTEHNSNHVPWLRLAETRGIERRFVRSDRDGEFDVDAFIDQMNGPVKVVAVQHGSNVTGCTTPLKTIVDIAHDKGAIVVVDGAQTAPHRKVDLGRIGADVYCFSMHKMLGPSGMGVMYGRMEVLERIRPLSVGGGTVGLATYEDSNLAPIPERFEAGLQNYAGIIGCGAALDYLSRIGMDNIRAWDEKLVGHALKGLEDVRNLHLVGPSEACKRGGIISFNIDGLGSHDIAMMVDSMAGIMIRSGMHCAHPFYVSRGIDGSARASTYIYNSIEEMDAFVAAVRHISEVFGNRAQHDLVAISQFEFSSVFRVRHALPVGGFQDDDVAAHPQDMGGGGEYLRPYEEQLVQTGGVEGIQHGCHILHDHPLHVMPHGIFRMRRDTQCSREHHHSAGAHRYAGHGEFHHCTEASTQHLPSTTDVLKTMSDSPVISVSSHTILNTGLSR